MNIKFKKGDIVVYKKYKNIDNLFITMFLENSNELGIKVLHVNRISGHNNKKIKMCISSHNQIFYKKLINGQFDSEFDVQLLYFNGHKNEK